MTSTPWGNAAALSGASYSAVELSADDRELYVLDQLRLPSEERYRRYDTVAGVASCIRDMVVRGAPAIGVTAAYGMAIAAHEAKDKTADAYLAAMRAAGAQLEATRPTAVNLAWAIARAIERAEAHAQLSGEERWRELSTLGRTIHREDVQSCRDIGDVGQGRIRDGATVLTHCNAGALATGGYGTALGVIRAAVDGGKEIQVLATETRPYLQGARLTAWELCRDQIPVTLIADNMVGHCMQQGRIDAVVVGADRVALNGDVANKIGTYGIACLARVHDVPFYVAAPWSTVDPQTATGADIVIEQRKAVELTHIGERRLAAEAAEVYNPAFDVTPARLINAIFTQFGAFSPEQIAEKATS